MEGTFWKDDPAEVPPSAAGIPPHTAVCLSSSGHLLAHSLGVLQTGSTPGGTWAGAKEQLDKLHLVPVYVRSTGEESKGLAALRNKGALPWPNPADTDDLHAVFEPDVLETRSVSIHAPNQDDLPFDPQRRALDG